MATIYTIGHSNVPVEQFLDLLRVHFIKLVVDVRSEPYSKYASQFNKREIERDLTSAGFEYVYLGDKIGGKPKSPGFYTPNGVPDYEKLAQSELFLAGLASLEDLAVSTSLALMCAEADPMSCHREKLIAWNLRKRGHDVKHILHDGSILNQCQGTLL